MASLLNENYPASGHMKLRLLFFLVLATSSLAFAQDAAPAPAAAVSAEEKTAIAAFKTQIEEVSNWIVEKQKAVASDPSAGMAMVGEVIARLKAVKTDGLPADLKGAWTEMGAVLTEMGDIFKNIPKPDPAKPEDAAKAFGEILPKIMAIQAKVEPVSKKLKEIGTKYGLDMTKVAPGK